MGKTYVTVARLGGYETAAVEKGEHYNNFATYDGTIEPGTCVERIGLWPDCGQPGWEGNPWHRLRAVVDGESYDIPVTERNYVQAQTVGSLIDALQRFPLEAPVRVLGGDRSMVVEGYVHGFGDPPTKEGDPVTLAMRTREVKLSESPRMSNHDARHAIAEEGGGT